MTDYKITETEKAAHHLQNLSDRPNAMSSYREGKLSANGMKKLFDDNFDFISDKHNKLGEALEAERDDRVAKHDELEMKHDELEMKHDELAAEHDALEAKHEALEASHQKTAAQVETLISEPINRIYPIGAVYISFEATSPSAFFGGAWEELTSGRFLMASSGAAGSMGGSEGHVHGLNHAGAALGCGSTSGYLEYEVTNIYEPSEYGQSPVSFYANRTLQTDYIGQYGNYNGDFVRLYGNTNSAASDLPPYITVHMWKRTA